MFKKKKTKNAQKKNQGWKFQAENVKRKKFYLKNSGKKISRLKIFGQKLQKTKFLAQNCSRKFWAEIFKKKKKKKKNTNILHKKFQILFGLSPQQMTPLFTSIKKHALDSPR